MSKRRKLGNVSVFGELYLDYAMPFYILNSYEFQVDKLFNLKKNEKMKPKITSKKCYFCFCSFSKYLLNAYSMLMHKLEGVLFFWGRQLRYFSALNENLN